MRKDQPAGVGRYGLIRATTSVETLRIIIRLPEGTSRARNTLRRPLWQDATLHPAGPPAVPTSSSRTPMSPPGSNAQLLLPVHRVHHVLDRRVIHGVGETRSETHEGQTVPVPFCNG